MARRIVALRDVERLSGGVVCRLVNVTDAHEHLEEGSEQFEGWLDFLLRSSCLNRGRDDGNAQVLSADSVRRRDHSDVDVYQVANKIQRRYDVTITN